MAHECGKHLLPTLGYDFCYAELKDRLLAGVPLSREELDFIGRYAERPSTDGWHEPGELSLYELDAEPSAEDKAMLQSLMNVGHAGQLEFLD